MTAKNFTAIALASTLIAGSALAATSTATNPEKKKEPRLIDKLTATYWGSYGGPSIGSPSRKSLDYDTAQLDDVQHVDNVFTLGYMVTQDITVQANYRVLFEPLNNQDQMNFTTKDPWLAVRNGKLLSRGNLNVSGDVRLYIPVQTAGKMNLGLRGTQITTYQIPNTKLTIGGFTMERFNFLRGGSGMPNMSLGLSALANYQLIPNVALTGWTDLLQYDFQFDSTLPDNKPIDVALGVNWDINPRISINPQLTFFPQSVSLQNTTIGAILSAKLL